MNIDWIRPDRKKGSGEPQTLQDLIRMVMEEGIAETSADAIKYIRRKIPQESAYQERIMKELRMRAEKEGLKAVVWKASQGMFSRSGVSDVLAMIGGVFFAVEVKRPIFGESSKLQENFVRDVIAAGGVAGMAIYPEDLDPFWIRAAEIRRGKL